MSDGRLAGERDAVAPDSTVNELSVGKTARELTPSDAETFDVVLVSVRAKPSKDDVLAAAIRLADVAGERLLRETSLESQPTVAVVDQFTVVEVSTNDRSGWADLGSGNLFGRIVSALAWHGSRQLNILLRYLNVDFCVGEPLVLL